MIPASNDGVWLRLARGGLDKIETQQLGLQLLRKRLASSSASDAEKAAEVYTFFDKYTRILGSEVAQILVG